MKSTNAGRRVAVQPDIQQSAAGTVRATVSVKEAARILGIGTNQAYAAARNGELPGVLRIGGRILISRAALHKMLQGDTPAPDTSDVR